MRQYSLCGDPADRSVCRLAVLREPDGRGGSALRPRAARRATGAASAARATTSRWSTAHALPVHRRRHRHHPDPADGRGRRGGRRDWRLVYGGRTRASMAFLDELRTATATGSASVPQDETGLLDLDALLAEPGPDTLVYCCGPEPLLAAVEQRCALAGGRCTSSGSRPRPATPTPATSRSRSSCARSGLTLRVPPGTSILEAVEDAGVPVLSSCREGTCGTCETAVLDGVPDHRDSVLTAAERAADDVMMICVSRSRSPRLVLDL